MGRQNTGGGGDGRQGDAKGRGAGTSPEAAAPADGGRPGLLPVQEIRALIEAGHILMAAPPLPGQFQPASLDLRLGTAAHRVRASFLPGPDAGVARKLAGLRLHTIDLTKGAVLETGCVYLVPLLESLALPPDVMAAANPKSSTGRLDVFTRVIADGVGVFDRIPHGYCGPLYAEICPQTFPVLVRTGSRLSQIRFRAGPEPARGPAGGIFLSVDLSGGADGIAGYRAKRHTGLVDIDAPASCDILNYWEPLRTDGKGRLILDPDEFYILASKETVRVPPTHAAEMVPFNPLAGEFRVHYAGFFDPGFGDAAAGGAGARAVLEVRSHKVPFVLDDGQVVGQLVYELLRGVPETLYGRDLGSHYQAQGLKLSKHFRTPPSA